MTKVGGLESLLNYMTENFFTKDDPAINEHHYHITKKQYNEEANNIYNIGGSKTFNTKTHRFVTEHYCNTKQNVNTIIIVNIATNTINNTEDILDVKKELSYKTCASNIYKPRIANVENNIYKRCDNRTFNDTDNIYKHVNQYSTDVFNNYKINKTHNVKKTYYNFTNDVVIKKHNTINTNGIYNVSKTNNLLNVTDNNHYTY